jgi:hypothetical protein
MADEFYEAAERLGLDIQALGDTAVLVLPENFTSAKSRDDLRDSQDSIVLAKHFKSAGVPCKTAFDLGIQPKVIDRRGAEVWLGVIALFVAKAAYDITVNALSTWVSNRYLSKELDATAKGVSHKIKIELLIVRTDSVSGIKFDGTAEDFITVAAGLKELGDREK